MQQEIAYLRSGFVRVIQTNDERFEVQSQRFWGEGKLGDGSPKWKKLYGVYNREKAIKLLESYA